MRKFDDMYNHNNKLEDNLRIVAGIDKNLEWN